VVAVILRSAMLPLCVGLGGSFVAALFLARLLKSLLYEISGADPIAYLAAAAVLLATGVLASAHPALRAAARDPLPALRTE
jgi:macrolide transport system ATP-binding/permease protein